MNTKTEPATATTQAGVRKDPMFDAMIKNFSQKAYIHNKDNDLSMFPHVCEKIILCV
jgi:hypothetical protein